MHSPPGHVPSASPDLSHVQWKTALRIMAAEKKSKKRDGKEEEEEEEEDKQKGGQGRGHESLSHRHSDEDKLSSFVGT
nr:hypothetical protein CFP56_11629 [Quercus suber]